MNTRSRQAIDMPCVKTRPKATFMAEQMNSKEKIEQFKERKGWFWRLIRLLTTPQEELR